MNHKNAEPDCMVEKLLDLRFNYNGVDYRFKWQVQDPTKHQQWPNSPTPASSTDKAEKKYFLGWIF